AVTVVRNGREALAALKSKPFDVILMDVQMPVMGGFEATAVIRQQEAGRGSHQPIIAMTAHAMKGDRERCLEAGMDDYVTKPVRSEELFAAIDRVLASAAGRPVDAVPVPTAPSRAAITGVDGVTARVPAGPAQPAAGEVIDRQAVQRRFDSRLLAEIVQVFLDSHGAMLRDVRKAIADRDAGGLERAAHTLKGAVGNFSATAAGEAAQRLEVLGREGRLSQAEEAWKALEREIGRLTEELPKLRKVDAA
ncbi:MAG TPA: response regulator, partial [Candidatus Polarisedimenticolia bacterium]|nr:response regulator [Candidatus Polarisedimenticolia bacterium]